MKVVIFCGGLGVRMGEATQRIPKPMIRVGPQPILWHIMKWYASWGHTDFILCLGYQAESIKSYFLSYNEAIANDFVLTSGGREVELVARDMEDWRITFVDTGAQAAIGQRLKAVELYLDDDVFLATYGDALTDAPLDHMIEVHRESGKSGLLMSVRPRLDYHVLHARADGVVTGIERLAEAEVRINGGFFVFRREVLRVIEPGEDLVEEPFGRLIERGELLAYPYDGFWEPMDTIKDKQRLDALLEAGQAPWRTRIAAN
jgi:glucose-1-phosphate cytidylyltransferase